MLLTAYLKQGYPLPAIGNMNLVNTQLQILKVLELTSINIIKDTPLFKLYLILDSKCFSRIMC